MTVTYDGAVTVVYVPGERGGASPRGAEVPPRFPGRLRGYRCRAVARLPDGRRIPLGGAAAGTPRLAMRRLRQRVAEVADQLDPPWARPVRRWLGDAAEHERALARLADGCAYAVEAADDTGVRYVVTAEPVS